MAASGGGGLLAYQDRMAIETPAKKSKVAVAVEAGVDIHSIPGGRGDKSGKSGKAVGKSGKSGKAVGKSG